MDIRHSVVGVEMRLVLPVALVGRVVCQCYVGGLGPCCCWQLFAMKVLILVCLGHVVFVIAKYGAGGLIHYSFIWC